jgi:hypothetical protein
VDVIGIPTGRSPHKVEEYYRYLQGHHETEGRVATWTVDWMSLAWEFGFVIALVATIFLWVRQYRTTRQRTRIYPLDSFGGWTTEAAGPATRFFLLFTVGITAFAIVLIVGHIVWGQKF